MRTTTTSEAPTQRNARIFGLCARVLVIWLVVLAGCTERFEGPDYDPAYSSFDVGRGPYADVAALADSSGGADVDVLSRMDANGGAKLPTSQDARGTGSDAPQPNSKVTLVVRNVVLLPPGDSAAVDVFVSGAFITKIAAYDPAAGKAFEGAKIIDHEGGFATAAWIDSHSHIVYSPAVAETLNGGVGAVVDHAAPMSFFDEDFGDLTAIGSGPMITAKSGYPVTSWGKDGYGIECVTKADVEAAVDKVVAAGAKLVKIPLAPGPHLADEVLKAAVQRAHGKQRKVSMHALSEAAALKAGNVGADVLAHTPTEGLGAAALAVWKGRAVISTLAAFGGAGATVANLTALRGGGVTVLYGTDYGNTSTAGIDGAEVALMAKAGMSGGEILQAATSDPAEFWGLSQHGKVEVGRFGNVLLYGVDPRVGLGFAKPAMVIIRGVLR